MRIKIAAAILSLACVATVAFAQAKQPKPKSAKERDALIAIQSAATPDAKLQAIEDLLTKFADTDFKSWALLNAMLLYEQKGDQDKVVIYGERVLEVDPKSYAAMLTLAEVYVRRTREFDLDKEEKLTKADDYAKKAIDTVNTIPKDRADLTDDQWGQLKKQIADQGHQILGSSAMLRKKYDVAIAEYKTAVEMSPAPDATAMARLAAAYKDGGKYDDAIATADKVLALPQLDATVKQFATVVKADATRLKASGAKPAQSGPAQVEIKQP